MKKSYVFLMVILITFLMGTLSAETWNYDFGTGTGSYTTASGASTTFLPAPATNGGTAARVRVGSQGGGFYMENPGLGSIGSGTELRVTAPTRTSVNKFSIYDYSASKSFYTQFKILFGSSTGDNASSGTFFFFQGDGATYSDANAFNGAQVFTGLQWVYGASGAITTTYRNGSSWSALGSTPFAQSSAYTVEIFGNNTTGSLDYDYSGTTYSVAANKQDIWINGILIGDDLAKAVIGNDANIDSWMFYGESSASNAANIFVDDFVYRNDLPAPAGVSEPTAQPTSLQFSNVTTTSFDVAFTAASPTADGYLAVRKSGSAPTTDPSDGTAYTAGTTLGDGTVVFSGSGTSFSQSSLSPGTAYYYKVYSFNGSGGSTNYLLTSPLQGNQTTTAGTVVPTLSTVTITAITDTSATSGGTITADGGASITAKGVCWNTTGTPTTANSITTDGSGTDAFVSSMTSLSPNQLYYVRAYATNSAGTAYGDQLTFTTLKSEPAAHVTSFAAGTVTSGAIPLTWTDTTADGYLIKGSTVSAFDIVPPEDGTTESNASLVRNVTSGTQNYTFTGLNPSTTYYFRIYPYNNSGVNINYLVSGTVPTVTTATSAVSTALYPGDIAILGVNTDTEKSFIFAALADIPAYTNITFTDNAWSGETGQFLTNESSIQWSHTSTLIKGSIVTIALPTTYTATVGSVTTNSNFNLAAGGDQIIAFEGTWAERPTDAGDSRFLYIFSTEAFITTGTPSSNQSYVPSALASYSVDMTTTGSETDNAYFANGATAQTEVSVTGSKAELMALFTDRTKYYMNDAGPLTFPTYTITVGEGGTITEPTAQPTSLVFSSVGANSFTVSYTAASPAVDGYIAIRKTGSAPTSDPVDGTSYTVGTSIGDGEVVYRGSGVTFNQSSLTSSTTYYYKIYSYNGSGSSTNYLTTSPLAGSQTTNASDPLGGYYNSVAGLSGESLKSGLHTLIKNTHTTEFSYTATTDQIRYVDEDPLNSNNIIQIYTGWSIPKADYGSGTTDWNKEHTWSKSHGDFGDNAPAGTDLHHLRPSDSTVNSQKSNRDFDEGSTAYTDASPYTGYSGVTGCYYSTNIWEPRDEDKGDVARMIFYMATRYEGTDTSYDLEIVDYTDSSPSGEPYYGKLSTLLTWHQADPPDAWELRRNNRIQERQGNRNPFIDHPEYVSSIWGGGAVAPSVTTASITSFGSTTATGGGEVTDAGTASVTARGVCYNTTGNPTLSDSFTSDGSGTGVFVSSLTSLTPGQMYYVKAYATSSVGTTYGNEVTFSTLSGEPAAHVTSFTAGTPTETSIPLSWTDASSTAGYLIKGSSVSYADITAPSDGTAETNAALVRNVAQGIGTYTFTGLSNNTTYYFKIWPYNNSGSNINYKTDGTVPQATAATTTPPVTNMLLEENFVYTEGTYLKDNGWTAHSGDGTLPPVVGNENLTYTDYPSTGGLCGETTGNGEDVSKTFTAQTSGDVYCSFLIKPKDATTSGDYIFHFGNNPVASDLKAKIFMGKDASNNIRFGLTKSANIGTAVVWTDYSYAIGTTYLIVLKYSIVSGTANDVVIAWINPDISGDEPAAQLSAVVSETDIGVSGIGGIGIRQINAALTAKFDGIRVATSWADLFPSDTPLISAVGTLNQFSTILGTPSASQSYTVSGINLTSNITVTAPTGFELSLTNSRTWSSSVEVPQTDGNANSTVYVRYNPSVAGPHSGNITHTSTGADAVNKAVSGTTFSGELVVTGSISAFSTVAGTPSNYQTYNLAGVNLSNYIDVVVTGPFQVRDTMHPNPSWETSLYLAPDYVGDIDVRYNPSTAGTDTGSITHSTDGSEAANVVINLSGTATLPYGITATPDNLNFTAAAGSVSDVQSYALSGANLTQNIAVVAPANFEISTNSTGPWTSTLDLAATYNANVYVRFAPATTGTTNAFITHDSGDAFKDVAVVGVATMPSTPMNIAAGQTITRDFNIIGTSATATLPTDWRAAKSATLEDRGTWAAAGTVTERIGGNAMTSSAGNGIYNYGAGPEASATDRAIGFLSSSSATKSGNLYAKLTNNGSSTITSLNVSYKAEKYRQGTNAAGFNIKTYYSLDGSTWTYAGDDLKASWAADAVTDGYVSAPGDSLLKSGVIAVEVPQSSSIYLCWGYGVTSGTTTSYAQGLGIDDVSITAYETLITSTPTFDPVPGTYVTTQYVTLSCVTSGATIYYTTNGDTPTTSSDVYSTPIEVTATTTIKALAVAAGHDNSPIATGVYTLPTPVATIAALRAMPVSSTVYKLTGEAILTLKSTTRFSKYIQDATGAILIDDANQNITTSYNIGDGITGIVGSLTTYAGMLQFAALADPGAATSTGNTLEPQTVTLADLNSTYQAKLVKIANVSISETGNFAGTTNYVINDGTNSGVLRTHYVDLDYIGTPIPSSPKTIVGVILQYTGGNPVTTTMQLVPRSLAEFTDDSAPSAPVNVTITVVGDDVQLNWDADPSISSWNIYASDDAATGFGLVPLATSNTNSKLLLNEAASAKRFYYVKAVR